MTQPAGPPQYSWCARRKILATVIGAFAVLVAMSGCASGGDEAALRSSEENPCNKANNYCSDLEPKSPKPEPEQGTQEPDTQERDTQKLKTQKPASSAAESRPKPKPQRQRYAVLDVVDGDTVEVAYKGGESVRVIGIDTPETVHPSVPDECWGNAASAIADRLLSGKRVGLVFDPSQGRRDAYGRLLAYLQVPGLGDYGLEMLKRGHAAEYTYDIAYRRQDRYIAAAAGAEAAGKAMWGRCGGADTPLVEPEPTPTPQPEPAPQPKPKHKGGPGGGCAPGYDPCVPPYPPDLDCDQVNGPIRITGNDPHGFDADGDGTGCDT